MTDRRMPYNEEAEVSVLGSMILDQEAGTYALEKLSADDFYRGGHAAIFRALSSLLQSNHPPDLVTVVEELRKSGELDQAGGPASVASILQKVPTASNLEYYTEIVREKALRRQLIRLSTDLASRGYDEGIEMTDLIAEAEMKIFDLTESRQSGKLTPLKELVTAAHDKIDKMMRDRSLVSGVPTGFKALDEKTLGLQPKDLVVLAARPSMGKTSLALNIAATVALAKTPVAVFSLEMASEMLALRLLCSEGRVSLQKVRSGWLEDQELSNLLFASSHLYEAPLFVDETANTNVLDIATKCRRQKRETGLGLVVIDYLQLLQPLRTTDSHERDIATMTRSLKAMAKELDVPVLLLSQLNRQCEYREDKRPMLADLRDSGAIEQDADLVAFIYRDSRYNPDTPEPHVAEILIAKNRNGPTGRIKLAFMEEFTRFENLTPRAEEVPGNL